MITENEQFQSLIPRAPRLSDDHKTIKKMDFALKKSKELDQTEQMNLCAQTFSYDLCRDRMWNPERYSLMYGTYLWDQSTPAQRIVLNQLYWVAYYSQIISAEIATIFFNQTAAAALYGIEDFRIVCDTLDLESAQERAHIGAFTAISKNVEMELFNQRIFSYPMRTPFEKTMVFSDLNQLQQWFRKWQLRVYSVLSSNSAFIGCQYFTVRGIRTLNGKMVQHQLSLNYLKSKNKDEEPIPSKVNYCHFMDESFHFNTSTTISHDVVNSLAEPSAFEKYVANQTLWGCQKDHYNFSTAINGIFWYDPSLYQPMLKVLMSPVFGLDRTGALDVIYKSFCLESEGALQSANTHHEAHTSYKSYLADFKFVDKKNKEMQLMSQNNLERHLKTNKEQFKVFKTNLGGI